MKSLAVFLFAASAAAERYGERKRKMVGEVASMLQDLAKEIEVEAEKEKTLYDKFACWCRDTQDEKKQAISDNEKEIQQLTGKIGSLEGSTATTAVQITQLKKDIESNASDLANADAQRLKEKREWEAKAEDLEMALDALVRALKVVQEGSGLKKVEVEGEDDGANATPVLLAEKSVDVKGLQVALGLAGALTEDERSTVQQWLKSAGAGSKRLGMLQRPVNRYQANSGPLLGILSSMQEEFTADLREGNEKESMAAANHEDLKLQMKLDGEHLKNTLVQREDSAGQQSETLGQSKAKRTETQEILGSNKEVLNDTVERCTAKANAWNSRSAARTVELAGINKAVEILSGDEMTAAHANATSFIQVLASAKARKMRSFSAIQKFVTAAKSLRLAKVAAQIRAAPANNAGIEKVKRAVDEMMVQLAEEEKQDIADKDKCEKFLANASSDAAAQKAHLDKLAAKEAALQQKKEMAAKEGEANGKAMADSKKMQDEADAQNAEETAAYRQKMKDIQTSLSLLEKAKMTLGEFYGSGSFVQVHEHKRFLLNQPKTPFAEGPYGGKNQESGNIIMIMQMLIDDLQQQYESEVKEKGEDDAAFVNAKNATNAQMEEMEMKAISLGFEKGTAEKNQQKTNKAIGANKDELESIENTKKTLSTENCAWVKTSFDKRRSARKAEKDGLQAAKNALNAIDMS